MSFSLKLKIKGQRKFTTLPQVRKVKIITDDATIVVQPEEFLRIGQAERYVFIYDFDDKHFEISVGSIKRVI